MTADFRRIVGADPTLGAGNFFHRFADYCPDQSLIVIETDQDIVIGERNYGTRVTVSLLRSISEQLALWLKRRQVAAGNPVGVFLEDGALYYIFYIAITRLGAVPVFINSKMPAEVASRYLDAVGCFAVICDESRANRLSSCSSHASPAILRAESIVLSGAAQPLPLFFHRENDPVLIAHTSGTTGAPKAVQFNHSGYFFGVRQQMFHPLARKVASALPHSHASGTTMLMSTMIRGIPLFVQTRKDSRSMLDSIERWQPNVVMAFPKSLVDLCRMKLEEWDLSSVSCWMSTGDASHERHIRRLIECGSRCYGGRYRKGAVYMDNLGSSEFAFAVMRNLHSPETNNYDRCIGMPFEWIDVKIFDDMGAEISVNRVGRLGVKSPSVTSGYWNNIAATTANLHQGYWLTGDLVLRRENGLYYHMDRTTDRAFVAERMLYSCQLEELLMKKIVEIFDCTVVGVDDGSNKEILVAVEPISRDYDRHVLEGKIESILEGRDIRAATRVEIVEPGWNEGLTGKKLKRVIRENAKANPRF